VNEEIVKKLGGVKLMKINQSCGRPPTELRAKLSKLVRALLREAPSLKMICEARWHLCELEVVFGKAEQNKLGLSSPVDPPELLLVSTSYVPKK